MDDQATHVYESPPSEPDDQFWLEQGKKMVEGSLAAVREAAKALMTGVGVVQGIYLGVLGLSDYLPKRHVRQAKGAVASSRMTCANELA